MTKWGWVGAFECQLEKKSGVCSAFCLYTTKTPRGGERREVVKGRSQKRNGETEEKEKKRRRGSCVFARKRKKKAKEREKCTGGTRNENSKKNLLPSLCFTFFFPFPFL
jgi:hypothetical protein